MYINSSTIVWCITYCVVYLTRLHPNTNTSLSSSIFHEKRKKCAYKTPFFPPPAIGMLPSMRSTKRSLQTQRLYICLIPSLVVSRTTMLTTLPNLSYSPTGIIWSEAFHSSATTKHRAYPRTDLRQLLPWQEFETEIHDAITAHMGQRNIRPGAQYDIGSLPKKPKKVSDEEDVRREASNQLHDLVVEVLEILGIEGEFMHSTSCNNQIIGAPDFSWLRNNVRHPLLVVSVSLTSILTPSFYGTGRVQDEMGGTPCRLGWVF